MTVAALALTLHLINVLAPPWPVAAALLAAGLVPMLGAPLVGAWVTVGAAAVHLLVPAASPEVLLWAPPAAPFAAYAAMRYGSGLLAAAAPVVAFTVLASWWAPTLEFGIRSALLTAGAALLGLYLSARHGLLRALTDRAERAEREQHLLAEQARGEERVRLAAEIHDLVTHRVSLMVLQAGALGLTAADPPTRQAAETLRATGCHALDELRELVGVLRAPAVSRKEASRKEVSRREAEPPDQPLLPALAEVVDAAGLAARLEANGDALVSPVVLRTARRAVQESLTNVRKHAPGAATTVSLHSTPSAARLTITNTAPSAPGDPALAAAGSGTGLLGLRERVSLVNGTLTAGPERDGGFRVEVTLPGRAAS